MWRKVLSVIAVIFICSIQASVAQPAGERPMYVSRWGYLYAEAGNKNEPLGVFATEAPVYPLDSTQTQYKVQVSNGDVGFIDRQPLKNFMDGKKSMGEPSQYFYRGAEGYQCPHFYVQVSELRVRKAPNTGSIAVRRARLNEMVCIDYMPLYKDGWVYVGDHFHEQPEYVQAKYLGLHLTYEEVLKDYLAVKGKDEEKELIQVGRLREIAWGDGDGPLKQALFYWKESYANAGVDNPKVDIDFELLLADKIAQRPEYEAYGKRIQQLQMHFIWQGTALFDGKITDKQMKAMDLQRVEDIPGTPECGWEPKYFYKTPNMIVAFEENYQGKIVGSVYKTYFRDGEMLVLAGERLDANFNERDFVQRFGDLLYYGDWTADPHIYRIQNGDAGQFILTFKDGRLFSYECMYYC
ncbi:hypothetical protein [Sphingobacterium thalpophilum]|uniref:hypothetical protein n=1 Tax=Sphingobacterium thalpophilum TaxID=259 RepID=UPI002D781F57|nr:hypothetical protein [Sphingobacterium thalpophilum]